MQTLTKNTLAYKSVVLLAFSDLLSCVCVCLLSLVCTALRGKTKAFNEMEANFKVRLITAS